MKSWRRHGWLALLAALVLGAIAFGLSRIPQERSIGFTDLVRIAGEGRVRAVHVDGDRVVITGDRGETMVAIVDDRDARHDLVERFAGASVPLDFGAQGQGAAARAIATAAPIGVLLALGAAYFARERRRG